MNETTILAAAEAAHEANRIYCIVIGDRSQKPWNEAPEWQRVSAIEGVRVTLGGANAEQQHEAWREAKRRNGWVHGLVKDFERKTHPCMVPYGDLPPQQRAKDALFGAVVRAMAVALEGVTERMVPAPLEVKRRGTRLADLDAALTAWAELPPEERTAALAAIARSTQSGKRAIRAAILLLEAAEATPSGAWSMADTYDQQGTCP